MGFAQQQFSSNEDDPQTLRPRSKYLVTGGEENVTHFFLTQLWQIKKHQEETTKYI